MVLDELSEMAKATPVDIGGTGTFQFGDAMDLRGLGGALGADQKGGGGYGAGLMLVLRVATTFTSGGAATVRFVLASDSQSAIATDGTATSHFSTGDIPLPRLTAATVLAVVPLPEAALERFMGLLLQVSVAALTGGSLDVFLTNNASAYRPYADARN